MTDVDPEVVKAEYRYEKLTWPEINEAIAQNKVVVLPVGSIEIWSSLISTRRRVAISPSGM